MLKRARLGSIIMIVLGHLMVVGISVDCFTPDYYTRESGELIFRLPNAEGAFKQWRTVELKGDNADYASLQGWISGSGCQVTVLICKGGGCDLAFRAVANMGDEITFESTSDDNDALEDFISSFSGGCGASCGPCPHQEDHSLDVVFKSDGCAAVLRANLSVDFTTESE